MTEGATQSQAKPEPGESAAGRTYDVIIIGAGIAGLSAAIYTTRERLATLVLERQIPGGQILTTARVENYPGFPEPIGGMELADRLAGQAQRFGAAILNQAAVTRIEPHAADPEGAILDAYAGSTRYRGRAMILAVGSEYRKLGVPGEKRLTGYGVSYCGTCDAPFYRDKHVVVVGGGNTALDEGLHLLNFAGRLTFVTLEDRFTASEILVERLKEQKDRVRVHLASTVSEVLGAERVEAVRIRRVKSGEEEVVPCDGVFVFIGLEPMTGFLRGVVDLDAGGFVQTHACTLKTSLEGVWAAGDARAGTLKQAATAAGDGVVAALNVKEYLKKQRAAP
ncbi:MAG TPA: FAD-dependent oxidoreductase [Phycisphaerae bacterium]|nr:FAD-dependent oxidoreductase [Phycisphaerae bacterium]